MTNPTADDLEEFVRRGRAAQAAIDEILADAELERAGDRSQPADVSAPSKAQQHCVND